ncbi:hypothetical protein V8068_001185 [Vibrio parahaemolyticus]|nr:hypothetical protein [Vibrio parahaemolyticus]
MNSDKSFWLSMWTSFWSLIVSLGLTGVLQVVILCLGIAAGYYALKKSKAESELAEIKLNKVRGTSKNNGQ